MQVFFRRSVPVGPEQVLLRGAHLRNTQWIFGESQARIILYTSLEISVQTQSCEINFTKLLLTKGFSSQCVMSNQCCYISDYAKNRRKNIPFVHFK